MGYELLRLSSRSTIIRHRSTTKLMRKNAKAAAVMARNTSEMMKPARCTSSRLGPLGHGGGGAGVS